MSWPSLDALRGAAHAVYARPAEVLLQVGEAPLLAHLSEAERERHARFHFAEDRDIFLVAHALTRVRLARALGCAPAALSFSASERGRPELAGPHAALEPRLRFNLSHTHGLVACALTLEADIGIDVERLDRSVELLAVGARVFSTRELAGLTALAGEAQRARFFGLWTLKEAYVKAIGKGLSAPLQAISFSPEQPDPVPVAFEPAAADAPDAWCFRRCAPGPGHLLAVALRAGPAAAISFSELAPAELIA
jgi:4'-phosphopantetheinyl transferase